MVPAAANTAVTTSRVITPAQLVTSVTTSWISPTSPALRPSPRPLATLVATRSNRFIVNVSPPKRYVHTALERGRFFLCIIRFDRLKIFSIFHKLFSTCSWSDSWIDTWVISTNRTFSKLLEEKNRWTSQELLVGYHSLPIYHHPNWRNTVKELNKLENNPPDNPCFISRISAINWSTHTALTRGGFSYFPGLSIFHGYFMGRSGGKLWFFWDWEDVAWCSSVYNHQSLNKKIPVVTRSKSMINSFFDIRKII